MTKEEAIKWLKEMRNKYVISDPYYVSIDMAIKALEQPDLTADQIFAMKEQEYMRGYEDGKQLLLEPCGDDDELYDAIAYFNKKTDEIKVVTFLQVAAWLRELKELRIENKALKNRCADFEHGAPCRYCPLECEFRKYEFEGRDDD